MQKNNGYERDKLNTDSQPLNAPKYRQLLLNILYLDEYSQCILQKYHHEEDIAQCCCSNNKENLIFNCRNNKDV